MPDFNVKYIFPGDNKDEILKKINYNFFQTFFNGIGEKGPGGNIGATGLRGQAGRDGVAGATGDRASNWYFSASEPLASQSQEGDVWVDSGATGGQQVYLYISGSWVYTGETLLTSGEFSTLIGASGPGGSSESNAIYINGSSIDKTLVLSDATGTTGSLNPNLAKLHISTDTSATDEFPTLGFAKTFLPQTPGNIISWKWKQTGGNFNKEWILPGNSTIQSGLSSTYSSTGGTANISSFSNLDVLSTASVNFTGATGTSGAFSLSTPNVLSFTSSNVSLSTSIMSVILGVGGTAYIQAAATPSIPLAYLQGNGGGANIQSTVSTSDNLLNIRDVNGNSILKSSRLNKFTFGSTGATGFKDTLRISTTAPNTFPTFPRSVFTNNYLDSGSPTNDICVITPTYTGSSSADGKSNRVYLSVGSNYSWADSLLSSGQSRTFDFFLNSATYSFGGIRVALTGAVTQTAQINDSASGPSGCQHIRITFFHNRTSFHYQAFSNGFFSCGWILYSTLQTVEPGPFGPSLG